MTGRVTNRSGGSGLTPTPSRADATMMVLSGAIGVPKGDDTGGNRGRTYGPCRGETRFQIMDADTGSVVLKVLPLEIHFPG